MKRKREQVVKEKQTALRKIQGRSEIANTLFGDMRQKEQDDIFDVEEVQEDYSSNAVKNALRPYDEKIAAIDKQLGELDTLMNREIEEAKKQTRMEMPTSEEPAANATGTVAEEKDLTRYNELVEAYKSGDEAKINAAAKKVFDATMDEKETDMPDEYDEGWDYLLDYDGNDPNKLAAQYVIRANQHVFLDNDADETYIKTGIKSKRADAEGEYRLEDFIDNDPTGDGEEDLPFREEETFEEGQELSIKEGEDGLYSVDGLTLPPENSPERLLNSFREKYPKYCAMMSEDGKTITVNSWAEILKDARKNESAADKKAREKYAERAARNAANAIMEQAKKLGVDVEVKTDTEGLSERKAKAKGWFDPKTGKIVIMLPNHSDAADIMRTLMHEAVGHYGLRKLFGKDFDTVLDNIFNNAKSDIQNRIKEYAKKRGLSLRTATEEYLASLAEDIDYERETTQAWWNGAMNRIIKFINDALRKLGVVLPFRINDNDMRAMLYRSYENMTSGEQSSTEDVYDGSEYSGASSIENSAADDVLYRVMEPDSPTLTEHERAVMREFEEGKTVKVYRAMQMIDGQLYPPMAAKVEGQLVEPTKIGDILIADERPDLAKNGKFKLDKANGSAIDAAYNPYWHTSRSPLNDQFSSAWNRGNLVTVEVEVPLSELTSGYKAEGAKDPVGETEWKSGPVSGKLAKEGKPRKVILSRYCKVARIIPEAEVAKAIADMLKDSKVEGIPFNTVTPSLREELVKAGVKITEPQKGNAGNAARAEYEKWKQKQSDMEMSGEGAENNIKPIGTGPFGNIYDQFKGDAKGAVKMLISQQGGEALGALYHREIGDIDLVWGVPGTKKSDGYGLSKLVKYHPEVVEHLQEILDDMHVVSRSENRVNLESEKYKAGVRLTWDNKKKSWLLTMFEKKNSVSNNWTDTVGTDNSGKQNDTATLQNTVSERKDTNNSANNQISEQESANNSANSERLESEDSRNGDVNARPETINLNGEEYNVEELEQQLEWDVKNILENEGFDDATVVGVRLIGSRMRGEEREDSDLDLLVEYEGDAREDDLFNVLNDGDNKIYLNGVEVDINPITEGKSGTIEQFMKRNAGFSKKNDIRFRRGGETLSAEEQALVDGWKAELGEALEQRKRETDEYVKAYREAQKEGKELPEEPEDAYRAKVNELKPVLKEHGFKFGTKGIEKIKPKKSEVRQRRGSATDVADTVAIEQTRSKVAEVAGKLGIEAKVVEDIDSIENPNIRNTAKDGAKGWYDTASGKVYVFAPNAESEEDIERTMLHESVGHKGLRAWIGDKIFNQAMMSAFKMLPSDVRGEIIGRAKALAAEYGRGNSQSYISEAMEEYFAETAEEGDMMAMPWYKKLYQAIRDAIRSLGFKLTLTPDDVQYMLWRGSEMLKRADEPAWRKAMRDMAMRRKFGVGMFENEDRRNAVIRREFDRNRA